jgi:26 proteasome complex subunit DSS1
MASGNETAPPTSALKAQNNASATEAGQSGTADPAMLEEDDEFEDFPVDGMQRPFSFVALTISMASQAGANVQFADWPAEESEMSGSSARLWEESWDDDDTSEDFSKQLK